jgi:hypothetical protein
MVNHLSIVQPQAGVEAAETQVCFADIFAFEIDVIIAADFDLDIPVMCFNISTRNPPVQA